MSDSEASNRQLEKTIIRVPRRPARTLFGTAVHACKGIVLVPLFWFAAALLRGPGLRFRAWCFGIGLKALFAGRRRLPLSTVFHLLFMPMDSTRYFEFDFVSGVLAGRRPERLLDVSSPRLMPVAVLARNRQMVGDLVNPDPKDIADTRRLVEFVAVDHRCKLHNCLIADAPLPAGAFDLITSVSVLEHIPDDVRAVQRIWSLLGPGGMFVLTVPCMARASEQYIDRYDWGVLKPDGEGVVFWQRFYDRALLEQSIFPITGLPARTVVFGEKRKGSYFSSAERKRSDPEYPYWVEPYMMARDYGYFDRIDDLPGEGVVGLVFVKSK